MNVFKDWLSGLRDPSHYAAMTVDTTGFHKADKLLSVSVFVPEMKAVEYWYLDMPDPSLIKNMKDWINPTDYLVKKEAPDAVQGGVVAWLNKHIRADKRFLVVFNRRFQRRFLAPLVELDGVPMLDVCVVAAAEELNLTLTGEDIEATQNEVEAQITGTNPASFKDLCVRFPTEPFPALPNVNKVLKLDYVYRSLMEVKGTW